MFRAPDAPIYSSAVLETARLSGHWVQVATFAEGDAPCAGGSADLSAGDAEMSWDLCLGDGQTAGSGPMQMPKPGRFAVPGMADWWVLWADADYRTMVIGTPGGQFGFVLNRTDNLPSDRLKAVRDIFQFNGYNTEKLVFF